MIKKVLYIISLSLLYIFSCATEEIIKQQVYSNTNVEDYEGDGTLNIFNSLVSHKVQHIWEWNGSKFLKVTY